MADTAFCDCLKLGLHIPRFVTCICRLSTRWICTAWKCGLPSIVIPPAIVAISDGAFSHCDDLENVLFPPDSSITSIHGFEYCHRLTTVTFSAPPCLRVIWGFTGTALPRIEIPTSVRKLKGFCGCQFLAKVIIEENSELTELAGLDRCPVLSEMTFPASLTSISGFNTCKRLPRLEIPPSLQLFNGGHDCRSLTEIVFQANSMLRKIDGFCHCVALSVITIPASVEDLRGFWACPRLATVSFPPDSRVRCINHGLDRGPDSCFDFPPSEDGSPDFSQSPFHGMGEFCLPDGCFSGCVSLSRVTIPPSVEAVTGFNGCSTLAEIFFADNGALAQINGFSACTSLVTITIPLSVKILGPDAFSRCYALVSVVIPPSVTTVEGFCQCNHLREVIFTQGGLLLINGFGYCFALEEVAIPASVQNIGSMAFCDCRALSCVTFADRSMLGEVAGFRGCTSLVRIELPPSVTSLGKLAFSGSTHLAEVVFPEGTKITQIRFYQRWRYRNDELRSYAYCKQAQPCRVFLTFRGYDFLKQQRRRFSLIQATRCFGLDIKEEKDSDSVLLSPMTLIRLEFLQ
jgi:hypothetical protein